MQLQNRFPAYPWVEDSKHVDNKLKITYPDAHNPAHFGKTTYKSTKTKSDYDTRLEMPAVPYEAWDPLVTWLRQCQWMNPEAQK